MRQYWKYIKPYLPFFIIGPLLMLTEVAGEIVLPKIMALMIDNGIGSEAAGYGIGYIISRALMMIGFIGVMIIGGIGGHYFSIKAAVSFSADLRQGVFEKVQNKISPRVTDIF